MRGGVFRNLTRFRTSRRGDARYALSGKFGRPNSALTGALRSLANDGGVGVPARAEIVPMKPNDRNRVRASHAPGSLF